MTYDFIKSDDMVEIPLTGDSVLTKETIKKMAAQLTNVSIPYGCVPPVWWGDSYPWDKPEPKPCICESIGADDTKGHVGETVIVVSKTNAISDNRKRLKTPACENHLLCYLDNGWKIKKPPVYTIDPEPKKCCGIPGTDGTLSCGEQLGIKYLHNGGLAVYPCSNHINEYVKDGWAAAQSYQSSKDYPLLMDIFDKPSAKEGKPVYDPRIYRTQKARGIVALMKYYRNVPQYFIKDIHLVEPRELIGWFVRPCPTRPRHGFVDSRYIEDAEQAEKIIEETKNADPEAEFVLMRKVYAKHSGIWTPGLLTVGTGNDGATTGTSAVSVPFLGTMLEIKILDDADIKDSPYVELLWERVNNELNLYEVQLRDGPKIDGLSENYIPSEVVVTRVIRAEGDLLDWESDIHRCSSGTVVYHPNGSLASHYAIHAVLNLVPVMITREPVVGETLVPTTGPSGAPNLTALRAGFQIGSTMEIKYDEAVNLMLAGCHHIAVWSGRYDVLLGAAMGCAWRLTVAASLGEARHASNRCKKKSRNIIYEKSWDKALTSAMIRRFRVVLRGFAMWDWPRDFGGSSWYRFAQWAMKLYNYVLAGRPVQACEILNLLVNSEHNSGWGFDKFEQHSIYSRAANNPTWLIRKIGPSLHEILSMPETEYAEQERKLLRYRKPIKAVLNKQDEITLIGELRA